MLKLFFIVIPAKAGIQEKAVKTWNYLMRYENFLTYIIFTQELYHSILDSRLRGNDIGYFTLRFEFTLFTIIK